MSERNGDHRFEFFRRSVGQTLANAGPRKLSALQAIKAAIVKEEQRLVAERPKVFLAMPAYSTVGTHDNTWARFMLDPSDRENIDVLQAKYSNSLLARSFNCLWAQALAQRKNGITHFAMLHTDVVPEQYWLDKLWEEMLRVRADLISVVMPIKNPNGITTVAVDNPDDTWAPRRLTMHEIMELPETFGVQEVIDTGLNSYGGTLLHSTGCWMCDLRRPWVDEVDENGELKVFFTVNDRIRVASNGDYEVDVQSEDWNFSRMILAVDPSARLYSTRKVRLEHKGEAGFPNDHAWGNWKTDEEFQQMMTRRGIEQQDTILTAETVEEVEPALT